MNYSSSRLGTLFTCPYQYYLKYVVPYEDRLPEKDTLSRLLGKAVHQAIEVDDSTTLAAAAEKSFSATFTSLLANADIMVRPYDNVKTSLASGQKMMRNYRSLLPKINNGEVKKEWKFEFDYFGYTLIGKIDWISKDILCDFKTGRYDPYSEFLPHNLQFAIYRLAFITKFGFEPKLVWASLLSGKLHEVNLNEEFTSVSDGVSAYLKFAQGYEEFLESFGYQPIAKQGIQTACNNCGFKYVCID